MKHLSYIQFFSLLITLNISLLLPLPVLAQDLASLLSDSEQEIALNYGDVYVYLGKELSNIGAVISSIKDLDDNNKSLQYPLKLEMCIIE